VRGAVRCACKLKGGDRWPGSVWRQVELNLSFFLPPSPPVEEEVARGARLSPQIASLGSKVCRSPIMDFLLWVGSMYKPDCLKTLSTKKFLKAGLEL
jgi:hypothetical protein